jgi:hypothetical protein
MTSLGVLRRVREATQASHLQVGAFRTPKRFTAKLNDDEILRSRYGAGGSWIASRIAT